MKYFIDYQYMADGEPRPRDDGDVVMMEVSDEQGFALVPNVGDYVHIDNSVGRGKHASFSGKVRSRLFRYIRVGETDVNCVVNIVVEQTVDDWGELVKE